MEFRDLKTQYQTLREPMEEAVREVLASGQYILGRQVEKLEEQLAGYVGVKHCISCANGTDALQLALMAWGLGPGDAVIVPDFTFFASAEAVASIGARPFFTDIKAETFNLDVGKLEERIIELREQKEYSLKAVMAVDLFGQPADYVQIREICEKHNLLLLEDGAQGFGGSIADKMACSFGDISTTSFFPAKPLGCYGDGGAIFTNDGNWAALLRSLRMHGKGSDKYENIRIGMNSRLDAVQAAILEIKLQAFQNHELEDVNNMADYYTANLTDKLTRPLVKDGCGSSWAQYSILLEDEKQRDGLQEYLGEKGIPTMIYYPKVMSEQRAFEGMEKSDTPVAKSCSRRVLSLPMGPYLKKEDALRVCKAVNSYMRKGD